MNGSKSENRWITISSDVERWNITKAALLMNQQEKKKKIVHTAIIYPSVCCVCWTITYKCTVCIYRHKHIPNRLLSSDEMARVSQVAQICLGVLIPRTFQLQFKHKKNLLSKLAFFLVCHYAWSCLCILKSQSVWHVVTD